MRAASYFRVSDGAKQDPANQFAGVNQLIDARGWHKVAEYIDYDSASEFNRKGRDGQQFLEMLEDARRRRFDVLVFWSLDRFSREGTLKTLSYLARLDNSGVRFLSYTEQFLDSVGPFRDVVIALLATMAKQESVRRSERIKEAIQRIRAAGGTWGQPVGVTADDVVALRERDRLSWPKIARRLGCGQATAIRRYRSARPEWRPLHEMPPPLGTKRLKPGMERVI